jgi:hypothetical protein
LQLLHVGRKLLHQGPILQNTILAEKFSDIFHPQTLVTFPH